MRWVCLSCVLWVDWSCCKLLYWWHVFWSKIKFDAFPIVAACVRTGSPHASIVTQRGVLDRPRICHVIQPNSLARYTSSVIVRCCVFRRAFLPRSNRRYMHRDSCGLWTIPPSAGAESAPAGSAPAAAHTQAPPPTSIPMDLEEEEEEEKEDAPNRAGTRDRSGKGKGKKRAGTTAAPGSSGSGSLSAKVDSG